MVEIILEGRVHTDEVPILGQEDELTRKDIYDLRDLYREAMFIAVVNRKKKEKLYLMKKVIEYSPHYFG